MRSWLPFEELREKVVVMSNEPYYKYKIGKLRPDGQPGFPTHHRPCRAVLLHVRSNWGEDPLPYYEPPVYGPERLPELERGIPVHDDHRRSPAGVLPLRA